MGVLQIARRAITASPHEWWTRGRQAIFTASNLLGSKVGGSALSPRGHLRSLGIQDGLIHWWEQRRNQWFLDENRLQALTDAATVKASCVPWILQKADDLLLDRLPLFSFGDIEYSGVDRWHKDFILDKQAPKLCYGKVPYLDPDIVGDHKYTWEPNRFAWSIWLGIAYRIRGDERYAEKFKALTLDWFESNPYPIGINYCSALEIAYRNYAWIWSLSLFSPFLRSNAELLDKLIQGIWIGSRHVEENLSTYFSPNTHITGEALGLFAAGAAIPEFKDATRWRNLGLSILEKEVQKQFFQDGMYRELSSGYHIYSTDFCLHAALIGKESGFRVPRQILDTGQRAARRLGEITPNDLIMPQFNDCDGGRLMSLVPNSLDVGPTLLAAESLFPRESFLPQETGAVIQRGYPLLMCPPQRDDSKIRRRSSSTPIDRDLRHVYDSGLATYRTNEGDYLLLRASNFGYMSAPHSHDGGLGVILYLAGTPVFLDNGVGSYVQANRNEFRTSSGKNTILLNGRGPSHPATAFEWKTMTDSILVSMRRFEDGFTARAKHDGFSCPATGNVFLQREIVMLDIGIVAIVDRWDSDKEIAPSSQFTINPELRLDSAQNVLNTSDSKRFHLMFASLNAGEEIEILHNEIKFSPNYGLVREAPTVSLCPKPRTKGGTVTFVSRCGPLERQNSNLVTFENGTVGIRFELGRNGIQVSNQETTSA